MRPMLPSGTRGAALIDAVVAILIVGAGMLVIAGSQMKLARSVDVSKQQGEAVKFAQQKLEDLRSFTTLTSASGVQAWADLATGSDTVAGNGNYTRSWTVGGASSDPMRPVTVALSWTDRSGAAQQFTLGSVISRTDPADVGSLGFPLPANTTLKRPKNRNLNIPVPATDLGDGHSVAQLAGNFAVVFSNDSGYVIKTCNFTVQSAADLVNCSTVSAYIVAGYISLSGTSSFPSNLAMNTAALTGTSSTTCVLANATDQNSGAAISGYRYYLCVITVPSDGAAWSGRLRLAGMSSSGNYLVCRFQYAAETGVTSNERNVQPYAGVTMSLDNQNYVIVGGSGGGSLSCPTVGTVTTTLHQNCSSSNANRAADCP